MKTLFCLAAFLGIGYVVFKLWAPWLARFKVIQRINAWLDER